MNLLHISPARHTYPTFRRNLAGIQLSIKNIIKFLQHFYYPQILRKLSAIKTQI